MSEFGSARELSEEELDFVSGGVEEPKVPEVPEVPVIPQEMETQAGLEEKHMLGLHQPVMKRKFIDSRGVAPTGSAVGEK